MPHAVGSDERSRQAPLQFVLGKVHVVAHVVPSQTCDVPQAFVQLPHVAGLPRLLSHPLLSTPSQSANPVAHRPIAHAPAEHVTEATFLRLSIHAPQPTGVQP